MNRLGFSLLNKTFFSTFKGKSSGQQISKHQLGQFLEATCISKSDQDRLLQLFSTKYPNGIELDATKLQTDHNYDQLLNKTLCAIDQANGGHLSILQQKNVDQVSQNTVTRHSMHPNPVNDAITFLRTPHADGFLAGDQIVSQVPKRPTQQYTKRERATDQPFHISTKTPGDRYLIELKRSDESLPSHFLSSLKLIAKSTTAHIASFSLDAIESSQYENRQGDTTIFVSEGELCVDTLFGPLVASQNHVINVPCGVPFTVKGIGKGITVFSGTGVRVQSPGKLKGLQGPTAGTQTRGFFTPTLLNQMVDSSSMMDTYTIVPDHDHMTTIFFHKGPKLTQSFANYWDGDVQPWVFDVENYVHVTGITADGSLSHADPTNNVFLVWNKDGTCVADVEVFLPRVVNAASKLPYSHWNKSEEIFITFGGAYEARSDAAVPNALISPIASNHGPEPEFIDQKRNQYLPDDGVSIPYEPELIAMSGAFPILFEIRSDNGIQIPKNETNIVSYDK